MTVSTTKMTMMPLLSLHLQMHIHPYLLIVHSLFIAPPFRTLRTRGDPAHAVDQDVSWPDASTTRQGSSDIPVTADEVPRSAGDVRRRWMSAGKMNSTT